MHAPKHQYPTKELSWILWSRVDPATSSKFQIKSLVYVSDLQLHVNMQQMKVENNIEKVVQLVELSGKLDLVCGGFNGKPLEFLFVIKSKPL